MNYFWEIIASNAIVATILAISIVLLSRVWKNAAAIHLLWVIVLLKFFTPPIVTAQLPFAVDWLPSAVSVSSVDRSSDPHAREALEQAATEPIVSSRGTDNPGSVAKHSQHGAENMWSVVADRRPRSLASIIVAVWVLGTACVAAGYAIRIRRFSNLLKNVESAPQGICTMVSQIASRLGLRRVPNVSMTPCALPPLVWSIGLRPRVILPSQLFDRLSGTAQSAILAHELAHVSRRDYLVRLLELAATTLFWWHPVVWWACSQLRELEEECCDSRALELIPNQARTYAAALVDTLEFLSEQPRVLVPLPTAIYSAGSLSRRIRMLTQNRTSRLNIRSAALVAAIAALPLVVAFAAEAPDSTNKPAAKAGDSAPGPAVLTGRVTNEAGEPIADARVRVAIPATNMRFLDSRTNHKKLETKADANGKYRLEITGITKPTTISIDAMQPGYRKLAGTLMSGGDEKEIEVSPGAAAEASFALKPSLYFKGVVVDEQGKPVPGVGVAANAKRPKASGGVERTVSNPGGSFELFNYSIKPHTDEYGVAKGVVSFSHPDYVSANIDDVYAVAKDQRDKLRVVLHTGRKISGTVLDVAGKPVTDVMIEAFHDDGDDRKATETDANGKFVLRGLVEGPTTLRAHALDIKQKIKLPINLDSDKKHLEVRLEAISLPTEPKAIAVLGMQLTDITPDLQAAYDLHEAHGALILDPGKDPKRLDIGRLVEGYNFWMVGDKRIGSVREFVRQILTEAAKQDTDDYSVRVVYSFKTLDFSGTNTQYLKLTKTDLEQLSKVLAEL